MAIKRTTKRPVAPAQRTISAGTARPIGTKITASATRRNARPVTASKVTLSPEKQAFARQLQANMRKASAITAATNTSNIAARPDFLELLPLFVQKLLILDVYGSVAMNSRQQLVPYFKFIAENTKGETEKGTVLSSAFVNRQGIDPNFTGRVIKNEAVAASTLAYVPVLPGSVTLSVTSAQGVVTKLIDDGAGNLNNASTGAAVGTINYALGTITSVTGDISATYQYDNENVGPDANGEYGAKMAKGYLQLDELNMIAEAQEIACYWSIYSAFAAQQEYGSSIGDIAKEAAISELTAEINSKGFAKLAQAAAYNPQFNWDASPILSGAVVPSDYLNMFKLKLNQAAASIYQATRLARPNKIIAGTSAAEFMGMINGFQAAGEAETVGPYKYGKLDNFDIYVDPNYDTNKWVMACKSQDIRRNSALFGEYMPITSTDAVGLANLSVQQGWATMNSMTVVNKDTLVSGKILGSF